jgi:hypothetical protein
MEIPTSKTPVAKCLALGTYTSQMMGQFSTNSEVTLLAAKLVAARDALATAERNYAAAEADMLSARVGVMFANHVADEGIKQSQRAAELAEGEARGPLVTHLFPMGTNAIVRLIGSTQVKEMRELEARFDGLLSQWPEAQIEKDKISWLRERYELAVTVRMNAAQALNDARSLRDLAKEDFLDVYAEIANRIRAIFPRNRKKQDLFFDAVTERSNADVETEKEVA